MEIILIYKFAKKLRQHDQFFMLPQPSILYLFTIFLPFYSPKISFARSMAEAITLSIS